MRSSGFKNYLMSNLITKNKFNLFYSARAEFINISHQRPVRLRHPKIATIDEERLEEQKATPVNIRRYEK